MKGGNMEATGCTVEQYEMLQKWVPMVEAAGIDTRGVDPFSVYLMAGSIMKDPEVAKRFGAKAAAHSKAARGTADASVAPPDTAVKVLTEMTPEEKAALKQRINATRVGLRK
jgi:hypothetical protein